MAWPLPGHEQPIPIPPEPGSYWERRDQGWHHCGVDLYAPQGSIVVAIQEGLVISIRRFTSPDERPYWNPTLELLIQRDKELWRYAELLQADVKTGMLVAAGEPVGLVGQVINPRLVTSESPAYIQALVRQGRTSMLHLEHYNGRPVSTFRYTGGNWLGPTPPSGLLDPTPFLLRAA